jgi:hypothetical protein
MNESENVMSLGEYVAPERMQGDKYVANQHIGRPMIVVARELVEGMRTKHQPDGSGVGIRIDVADLAEDKVYIGALWMSGALVDGLKPHVATGTPLPVKIDQVTGASGNPYLTLVPLQDKYRELAEKWYAANPTRIDDERKAREAEANPLGTVSTPASAPAAAPAAQPAASAPAPAPASGAMGDDELEAALARLNS